jgi:hypothetical protein
MSVLPISRRASWLAVPFVALLLGSPTLDAATRIDARGADGVAGNPIAGNLNATVQAKIYIANNVPLIGFQLAITHDPAYLQFISATWKGTALENPNLHASAGPAVFQSAEVTAGTPTGVKIWSSFDLDGPTTYSLPAGASAICILSYKALKLTDGTPTRISFASQFGTEDPIIKNGYVEAEQGQFVEVPLDQTKGVDVSIGPEVSYTIGFQTATMTADQGVEIVVPIVLTNNPLPIDGFSLGVKHDASRLELLDVTVAGGITSVIGGPADERLKFFAVNETPAGGTGFTAALFLTLDPFTDYKVLDPDNSPHHILDARYRTKGGATQLEVVSNLGTPKVEVLFDIAGVPQRAIQPSANPTPTILQITVGGGGDADFIRGDINQSGTISVTDAIGILRYLFDYPNLPAAFKTTEQNCLLAFNINGGIDSETEQEEEKGINVTDAILLLKYTFSGQTQTPPAPPFGATCGPFTGKASERMRCKQFTCP